MARRLRIQFSGAMYHVINRGNYRRDVFESVGAAKAFESALAEACLQFRWRIHAYVIMRNHYHLALETPEPNLVEGMHWLQSAYATRFNRFRTERGHLFQGRYQALLIENPAALARVANYIHLNPVRAGIVTPEQAKTFRWSSLARFVRPGRPSWLVAAAWLPLLGHADTPQGWIDYCDALSCSLAQVDFKTEEKELCSGWAIGTTGWKRAIAHDHRNLALHQGIAAEELRDLKHARWAEVLRRVLARLGKTSEEAASEPKGIDWKCDAAEQLRREAGAPFGWIAHNLYMGSPNSVRVYLSGRRQI